MGKDRGVAKSIGVSKREKIVEAAIDNMARR